MYVCCVYYPNKVFLYVVKFVKKKNVKFIEVHFRYLNDYEILREPPLIKPDAKELHPDVHSDDVPPTMFHNYLDEFLQAIRVFGFLEKPVRMIPRISWQLKLLRCNRFFTNSHDIFKHVD